MYQYVSVRKDSLTSNPPDAVFARGWQHRSIARGMPYCLAPYYIWIQNTNIRNHLICNNTLQLIKQCQTPIWIYDKSGKIFWMFTKHHCWLANDHTCRYPDSHLNFDDPGLSRFFITLVTDGDTCLLQGTVSYFGSFVEMSGLEDTFQSNISTDDLEDGFDLAGNSQESSWVCV